MTQRTAIIKDLQARAERYRTDMPLRERRHLSIKVKRLYAEFDNLTEDELKREV